LRKIIEGKNKQKNKNLKLTNLNWFPPPPPGFPPSSLLKLPSTPPLLLWLNPHELPFIFSTLARKQFFHHLLNQPHFQLAPPSLLNQLELPITICHQPPATPQIPHFLFFLLHAINTVGTKRTTSAFFSFFIPSKPHLQTKQTIVTVDHPQHQDQPQGSFLLLPHTIVTTTPL